MSRKRESVDVTTPAPRRSGKKPRNHRELGQAVFAEVDPVAVAQRLLNSESEAVKVRALETLVNWAFGSPAAAPPAAGGAVRIAWNVPRPAREAPAWAKLAKSQSEPPEDPREEP